MALKAGGTVALLAAAWGVLVATGGRPSDLSDLMYVPILVAASLFGLPGGVVAGGLATLLAGPMGPAGFYPDPRGMALQGSLFLVLGAGRGAVASLVASRNRQVSSLVDRLDRTYGRTLSLVASAVELRDIDTAGHSARVAANARALGTAVGLDEDELTILYWAGMLHDVGKIAVPESILRKAEPLTADEWRVMRSHVTIGRDLIAQSSVDFEPVAEAVGAHHERWDGSGYPCQKRGTDIPLPGRILAVADVFEALTSPRPYRQALGLTRALAYLKDQRGSQFDPSIVDAFERLLSAATIVVAP